MDKPTCHCGKEMVFLLDNKVTELWGCPTPSCGRVLLKQKSATSGTFYIMEGEPDILPSFCSEDLVVDFARYRVSVEGREVNLTVTEYRVLSYLAHNAGQVVTPDQILQKVWGEDYIGETHLLQVSMARLRKKLGDDARNPRYILTRPGIGYMMVRR